jgi:hypothetical protein
MNKLQTKIVISHVAKVRVRNNECWMALLALAVEARPRKAKEILRKITENDREITQWLSRI